MDGEGGSGVGVGGRGGGKVQLGYNIFETCGSSYHGLVDGLLAMQLFSPLCLPSGWVRDSSLALD